MNSVFFTLVPGPAAVTSAPHCKPLCARRQGARTQKSSSCTYTYGANSRTAHQWWRGLLSETGRKRGHRGGDLRRLRNDASIHSLSTDLLPRYKYNCAPGSKLPCTHTHTPLLARITLSYRPASPNHPR
jgi:hypothetical protein